MSDTVLAPLITAISTVVVAILNRSQNKIVTNLFVSAGAPEST